MKKVIVNDLMTSNRLENGYGADVMLCAKAQGMENIHALRFFIFTDLF